MLPGRGNSVQQAALVTTIRPVSTGLAPTAEPLHVVQDDDWAE
ncbi:MAG: hypothetical protein AVDCRST_MAG24-214 [uncultured Nocardioidaceae bacterium]|uniref:Uncharacterized protein n=1 Tax=uncultured Nocardioidaceae bacterium TaxID=253824 RepID=A0A6J4L3J5_9ACTN|nr:MAG: hypothetical protein AVDCRST_MAG24-214 [uncultured Nocardioidaceae bacterium]